jgi:hypothetical protein
MGTATAPDDTSIVHGIPWRRRFASPRHWLACVRLSMWSVARDDGNSAGAHYASPDSSGIAQHPFDFSTIFHQFDHIVWECRVLYATPRRDTLRLQRSL